MFSYFYYIIGQFHSDDSHQEKGIYMKKLISVLAGSAVAMSLLVGCGSASLSTPSDSVSGHYELQLHGYPSTKTVHHAVVEAGESMGLIMTEFKSDEIIAERADGDDSATATVIFSSEQVVVKKSEGDIGAKELLESVEELLTDKEGR